MVVLISTVFILYQTFDVNPFEKVESNARLPEPVGITVSKTDSEPTPTYKREKRKIVSEKIENSRAKPEVIIEIPTQLSHLDETIKEESETKKESAIEEIPEETDQAGTEAATKLVTTATTPEAQSHINLTGEWRLIHKIERTVYNRYKGMTLGYRVTLKQNGKNIIYYSIIILINEIKFR